MGGGTRLARCQASRPTGQAKYLAGRRIDGLLAQDRPDADQIDLDDGGVSEADTGTARVAHPDGIPLVPNT
jgi:hypothetical protein